MLSGTIPDALTMPEQVRSACLQGNRLSGTMPESLLSLTELRLNYNRLSGAIPKIEATKLNNIIVSKNKFSGSVPGGALTLGSRTRAGKFLASHNSLSGSLGVTVITTLQVIISDNQLTGSLPAFWWPSPVWVLGGVLLCSRNMLEGTIPATITPTVGTLALCNQASGRTEGMRGPLPATLSRATQLDILTASNHNLGGIIPPLHSSLWSLVLHNNQFQVPLDM